MKLVNPIGRNVTKISTGAAYEGDISPRGCTCVTEYDNFTALRQKSGGTCACVSQCLPGNTDNAFANGHRATAVDKY